MIDVGAIQHLNIKQQRQIEFMRRNLPPDYSESVTFFGAGGVTKRAIEFIIAAAKADQFIVPIGEINIVGRNSQESVLGRKKTILQGRQVAGHALPNIFSRSIDELSDILSSTNYFFFTASNHAPDETNRSLVIDKNIELVDLLTPYFENIPTGYQGLINFVSNLPEALAHYAANTWKLPDYRQITAHVPLDLLRFDDYLRHKVLSSASKNSPLRLQVGAYHDLPYAVVSGAAKVLFSGPDEESGGLGTTIATQDISRELLRKGQSSSVISKALLGYVPRELELQNISKREKWEGPTIIPTGAALADLLLAMVNRTSSVTCIPQLIAGKWYFASAAVSFENGFPELNPVFYNLLSEADHKQIRQRIAGDFSQKDSSSILSRAKNFTKGTLVGKKPYHPKSLEQHLKSSIHADKMILPAPTSTEVLHALFNQKKDIKPRYPTKIISITANPSLEKKILKMKKDQAALTEQFKEIKADLEKSKAQTPSPKPDFRELLAADLSTTVFVDSLDDHLLLRAYSFNQSLHGRITAEYLANLKGTNVQKKLQEQRKMLIHLVATDANNVYILTSRSHDSDNSDYRLFKFCDDSQGKKIGKLIKNPSSRSKFEIQSMIPFNGRLYFGAKQELTSGIYLLDEKTRELRLVSKTRNIPEELLSISQTVFIDKTGLYKGSKQLTKFRTAWTGYSDFLEKNTLAAYSTETSLVMVDVVSGAVSNFASQGLGAIASEYGSQIQLITSKGNSAFEIVNFPNKEKLFSGSNGIERETIQDPLFKDFFIVHPYSQHTFFGQTENAFYAVYHQNQAYHIEQLNITDFKNLRGRKND